MITTENQVDQIPTISPFPFLKLPVELRLRIYRYLVPTRMIYSYEVIPPEPFRHDDRHCYSAILRTCRTICNEAMGEWYGSALYMVVCNLDSVYAMRKTRVMDLTKRNGLEHSGLRFIKSMLLSFGVDPVDKIYRGRMFKNSDRRVDLLETLVALFTGPDSKLRHLQVRIGMPYSAYGGGSCARLNEMKELLEWIISPLHAIRELADFSLVWFMQDSDMEYKGLHALLLRMTKECQDAMAVKLCSRA
ncbi:hypothetical protein AOQ84DRAFT_53721 [Glonium stellatum]|uniref:2EXR domain-containing protein n=1 Tax=Glonium stellatum TaxID=574774 RepID=A0A8E2F066_9PEZI|nr:hypothetical protein AOQ84DRAFT_53721 [Glonium stellatum]